MHLAQEMKVECSELEVEEEVKERGGEKAFWIVDYSKAKLKNM